MTTTDPSLDLRAELTFLGDVTGTPTNYFDVEPPPGASRLYPRVRREVAIWDARSFARDLSVDGQGLAFANHPDGVLGDFRYEPALRSEYYPAIERLVRDVSGAAQVVIFDHTHRSSAVSSRSGGGVDIAVDEAHNDYTESSGPRRVRELLGRLLPGENPDELMCRRYAIFNVWRPTNGTVEQMPLAICDLSTMRRSDFVDAELKWRHRTGYVCAIRYDRAQRWLHFPAMQVSEVLVFKCYDSIASGSGVRFGAHTAFVDPRSRPDARPRESIEVRAIALFQ